MASWSHDATMRGETHLIIGSAVAFPVAWALRDHVLAASALEATGVVCGLGPDIDSPRSKISRWTRTALTAGGVLGGLYLLLARQEVLWALVVAGTGIALGWLRLPMNHRGATHWIAPTGLAVGVAAGTIAGVWLPDREAFAFGAVAFLAWTSHTLADLTNKQPTCVFPFVRLRGLGMREGGRTANAMEALTVVACITLCVLAIAHHL